MLVFPQPSSRVQLITMSLAGVLLPFTIMFFVYFRVLVVLVGEQRKKQTWKHQFNATNRNSLPAYVQAQRENCSEEVYELPEPEDLNNCAVLKKSIFGLCLNNFNIFTLFLICSYNLS